MVGSAVSSSNVAKADRSRRRRRRSAVARAAGSTLPKHALLEPLENRTLLSTTYYVSPSGSDNNSGTSSSSPFKDISKVNSLSLHAGDNVLFQGGQTFSGSVMIRNAGSSSSYVTFGSYGSGKATISSGGSDGFEDYNASGVMVQNLNFIGWANGLNQDGVKFEANSGGLSNIAVENCSISGYYYAGILVQGDSGNGFSNIQFTENTIYNNVDAGINLDSTNNSIGSHHDVYIAYNDVYNNYGSTDSAATGSGMELGSMNGATVQDNVATDNGAQGLGGCGIWAYDSTGVTFQYNISGDNHTAHATDGDGFDFDSNTSDSVMQYNYAYDNDGNGFQLNQWQNDSDSNNDIIRYNIAQDNGQKNAYADFEVWGDIQNSSIYGNTGYIAPATRGGSPYGIKVHNSTVGNLFVNNVTFANNIIVTTGGVPAVFIPSAELSGAKNLKFEGDDYWAQSGSLNIDYGSSDYNSVSSWQSSTGQEKLSGESVGLQVSPGLVAAGQGASLTSASQLSSLTDYKLNSSSPLITAGVNLPSVGLSVPSRDFFGNTVSSSYAFSIGADQATTEPASASTSGASISSSTSTSSSSSSSSGGTSATPASAMPSGWTSADIGSVGAAGSASYSNGTYTISGSGADFSGTADAFHYVYSTLSGNGTIVAEVSDETGGNNSAKAGIMFRDGTAANAREVSLSLDPTGLAHFDSRTSAGANTSYSSVGGLSSTEWLKLVRNGNTITAYLSSNDSTWTTVSSATLSLDTALQVGLAVTAHDAGKIETATFSNVSVTSTTASTSTAATSTASTSLPSGWTSADIGSVGAAGSASYSNGSYTVTGSGADITGTADAFHYVYTTLDGNGTIVAEVSSQTDANGAAKAGLMIRDGTAANAKEVSISKDPSGNAHFDQRTTTGGNTSYSSASGLSSTEWLKLVRSGNTVTSYVSSDDNTWKEVGSATLTLDTDLEVGLCVSAHDAGALETATFSNVSITT